MSLIQRYRFRLSPRRYHQKTADISVPSRGWGERQWIIARSLCLYRLFRLADVPVAERRSALEFRIRQWSPFGETGSYIALNGDTAQVWIWDEAKRRAAAEAVGVKSASVIPETVLRAPAQGEVVRMIACMEGEEGQAWSQGKLIASHFWLETPADVEKIRFLIANGFGPDHAFGTAEELRWLSHPWAKNWAGRSQILNVNRERLWIYGGLALFVFGVIWHSVSIWKWSQAHHALERRLEILTEEIEPIMDARSRAVADRQAAEQLLALAAYPPQLELMAAVAEKLAAEVVLVEWRYGGGRLSFILQGENLDPRYYVKVYEDLSPFSEVTAENGRRPNQLMMEMAVKPIDPHSSPSAMEAGRGRGEL